MRSGILAHVSLENIERNRGLLAAYNARNIDAMIDYFDAAIELQSAFAAVEGVTYRGHDGIRRWHHDLQESWGEDVRVDPEAYFDLGERTLVFYTLRGRGARSGMEVAMSAAYIVRWSDGLAVHLKAFADREQALRDLDLAATQLEPIAP